MIRLAAGRMAGRGAARGGRSAAGTTLREGLAGASALALFAVPLVLYSFAVHEAYGGGTALKRGLAATALAVVVSVILARRGAIGIVNRSSLAQDYGARLARAFLGATNPVRRRSGGEDVTQDMPGDDVASLRDYRPHEAGGPFPLINLTVNQTIDSASHRVNHGRPGENLAVSPLGLSIGRRWHAAWSNPPATGSVGGPRTGVTPLGDQPGTGHPLAGPSAGAAVLTLRQWMAVSGSGAGAKPGSTTRLGTALLCGLANVRAGYWWIPGSRRPAARAIPA